MSGGVCYWMIHKRYYSEERPFYVAYVKQAREFLEKVISALDPDSGLSEDERNKVLDKVPESLWEHIIKGE